MPVAKPINNGELDLTLNNRCRLCYPYYLQLQPNEYGGKSYISQKVLKGGKNTVHLDTIQCNRKVEESLECSDYEQIAKEIEQVMVVKEEERKNEE